MKRNLVVTSSTIVRSHAGVELDDAIAVAIGAERQRLEAYLYSGNALVAVTHDVEPYGEGTKRVTQRALVTVPGHHAADARTKADYQSGRLQSGSFGVIDYVEDEMAAREHLGITDDPSALPTDYKERIRVALQYAIDALPREEVMGSMGLDSDSLSYSYVIDNGVERERTEDDLAQEIKYHEGVIQTLQDVLANLDEIVADF